MGSATEKKFEVNDRFCSTGTPTSNKLDDGITVTHDGSLGLQVPVFQPRTKL